MLKHVSPHNCCLFVFGHFPIIKLRIIEKLVGFEAVLDRIQLIDHIALKNVLSYFKATIGESCDINSGLCIHNARNDLSNLSIGDHCHIGKCIFLDLADKITIEARVTISMNTSILTHLDVGQSGLRRIYPNLDRNRVLIKESAYIGAGCIILPGVTIGEFSFIGAGSVVTQVVPPYSMAYGVPATVHRKFEKAIISDVNP